MIGKRTKIAAAAALFLAAGVCYVCTVGGSSSKGFVDLSAAGKESSQMAGAGETKSSGSANGGSANDGSASGGPANGGSGIGLPETGADDGRSGVTGSDFEAVNAGDTGTGAADESGGSGGAAAADGKQTQTPVMWIHVCGEVDTPGVYELAEGSRVYQAVEAAGGFTEAAQQDYLNMAQELADGMKVEIPDRETARRLREQNVAPQLLTPGSPGAGASSAGGSGGGKAGSGTDQVRVNLNTASREELMTLRGVGASRADDIIAYREGHGPFKKIEDIMKVSGIKEAMFDKIKGSITVQ